MNNTPVNHTSTGYQPPHWFSVVWDFIKSLFIDHELVKLSTVAYPASKITDITAIPVAMQALQPDCVENAVTFAKQFVDYKTTGKVPMLSPRFLFNVSSPSENGTSLKTALERARMLGIADTSAYVNDTSLPYNQFVGIPSPQAYQDALNHRINGYMMTTDVASLDLKSLINQCGVVIIGCKVDSNWWLPSWSSLKIPLVPPASNSPTLSYHCVALYGYDANGNFYGRNWWSNQWNPGMGGNFTINQAYLPDIYEVAVLA